MAPRVLVTGDVLNVATGLQATVDELADAIGEALGRPVEKEFLPTRTGDVAGLVGGHLRRRHDARLRAVGRARRRAAADGRRAALAALTAPSDEHEHVREERAVQADQPPADERQLGRPDRRELGPD